MGQIHIPYPDTKSRQKTIVAKKLESSLNSITIPDEWANNQITYQGNKGAREHFIIKSSLSYKLTYIEYILYAQYYAESI